MSSGGDDSSIDLSLLSEGSDDELDQVQQQQRRGTSATDGAAGSSGEDEQQQQQHQQDDGQQHAPADDTLNKQKKNKKISKMLSKEKLQRLKAKHEQRGIIYVSRIPPHMKPAKLRQLLSQYGEIGRVYCTPEDPLARKKRKQHGGNTGGWHRLVGKASMMASMYLTSLPSACLSALGSWACLYLRGCIARCYQAPTMLTRSPLNCHLFSFSRGAVGGVTSMCAVGS